MARQRRPEASGEPGIAARFDGQCPRCPAPIRIGDRIVYLRGRPIHVGCASGGDE